LALLVAEQMTCPDTLNVTVSPLRATPSDVLVNVAEKCDIVCPSTVACLGYKNLNNSGYIAVLPSPQTCIGIGLDNARDRYYLIAASGDLADPRRGTPRPVNAGVNDMPPLTPGRRKPMGYGPVRTDRIAGQWPTTGGLPAFPRSAERGPDAAAVGLVEVRPQSRQARPSGKTLVTTITRAAGSRRIRARQSPTRRRCASWPVSLLHIADRGVADERGERVEDPAARNRRRREHLVNLDRAPRGTSSSSWTEHRPGFVDPLAGTGAKVLRRGRPGLWQPRGARLFCCIYAVMSRTGGTEG
jgi:hypothetical protein